MFQSTGNLISAQQQQERRQQQIRRLKELNMKKRQERVTHCYIDILNFYINIYDIVYFGEKRSEGQCILTEESNRNFYDNSAS